MLYYIFRQLEKDFVIFLQVSILEPKVICLELGPKAIGTGNIDYEVQHSFKNISAQHV